MDSQPIFIIGFTGAGKTTYGKKLAHDLQLPFVDLDVLIEQTEEKTIAQIFAENGEDYFRNAEADCLRLLPIMPSVIATGGGTPCFYDNLAWMKSIGKVVFLNTAPKQILQQLLHTDVNTRPILKGKSREEMANWIEATLAERMPFYEQADEVVELLD